MINDTDTVGQNRLRPRTRFNGMTVADAAKLEKVIALAAKTGQIICAPDVYEAIKSHLTTCPETTSLLVGIRVVKGTYLAPGTIIAGPPRDLSNLPILS